MIDRCVLCGEPVPEGRQVCPVCIAATVGGPPTRADRIRSMTDHELARHLFALAINEPQIGWCRTLDRCIEAMDEPGGIPDEWCLDCILHWLAQPAEEVPHG